MEDIGQQEMTQNQVEFNRPFGPGTDYRQEGSWVGVENDDFYSHPSFEENRKQRVALRFNEKHRVKENGSMDSDDEK